MDNEKPKQKKSIWGPALKDTPRLFVQALKSQALPLTLVFLLTNIPMEIMLAAFSESSEDGRLYSALTSACFGLLEAFFSAIVILPSFSKEINPTKTHSESAAEMYRRIAKPLCIESVRSMTHILLGAVLFLLPGLVFSALYTFIPFVVAFDQDVGRGQADALKRSRQRAWQVIFGLFFLILLQFALELSGKGLTQFLNTDLGPLAALITDGIQYLISIATYCLIFGVYRRTQPDL